MAKENKKPSSGSINKADSANHAVKKSKSGSSSSSSKSKSSNQVGSGKADHVIIRNLFALSVTRRMVVLVILACIAAALSVFSAFQIIKAKTPPQYIQLTEDGRIFPILPLSQPNATDGEIMHFAVESVKWVNTFDYRNWQDQLQLQASRFSIKGWRRYVEELVRTDNLNTIQAESLVTNVTFTGEPRIEKSGVIEELGTYAWLVKVPVQINYASSEDISVGSPKIPPQSGEVSLYIVRAPLEVSLRGYAIEIYQFELK